eukprot:Colp12_sorted_trinity150504_noHs@11093
MDPEDLDHLINVSISKMSEESSLKRQLCARRLLERVLSYVEETISDDEYSDDEEDIEELEEEKDFSDFVAFGLNAKSVGTDLVPVKVAVEAVIEDEAIVCDDSQVPLRSTPSVVDSVVSEWTPLQDSGVVADFFLNEDGRSVCDAELTHAVDVPFENSWRNPIKGESLIIETLLGYLQPCKSLELHDKDEDFLWERLVPSSNPKASSTLMWGTFEQLCHQRSCFATLSLINPV